MGYISMDCEHHVVFSMEDITKLIGGYCFYIISEPCMTWGIFGITRYIVQRFCQYLMKEHDALLWKEGVHIYIWRGDRKNIRNLETKVKKLIRENETFNDIKTINERGNQVEFFPNEYVDFMVSLVNKTIQTTFNSSRQEPGPQK